MTYNVSTSTSARYFQRADAVVRSLRVVPRGLVAIEDHLADRLDLWGLDAAGLFTAEEVRAAFFR